MSRRPSRLRQVLAAAMLVGLVLAVLVPSDGEARPGGGSSYRSGSSSSSSSSSSGSRSGSRSSSSSSSGGFRSGSSSTSSSSTGGVVFGGTTTSSSSSSSSSSSGSYSRPEPDVIATRTVTHRERTDGAQRRRWTNGTSVFDPAPPRPGAWPPSTELSDSDLSLGLLLFFGVPLFFVGAFVWGFVKAVRGMVSGWSTKAPESTRAAPSAMRVRRRSDLGFIRQTDPAFSAAILEDFLYALYTEVRVAVGAGRIDRVAPYLSVPTRAALARAPRAPVAHVIVGAMRVVSIDVNDPLWFTIEVEFETNYTEGTQAYWARERWRLSRVRTARSRAPVRSRVLDCPGCGAPIDRVVGGQCRHCARVVDNGAFDWIVVSIEVEDKEPRGPMLEGTTEEQGTELPTVFEPMVADRLAGLERKDPSFDRAALERRVGLVFSTMQVAWSSLEWQRARPFLSDNLWEAQRYWIEAYKASGLRNVLQNARIDRMEIAAVSSDPWFDAITVRVHATSLDYTIRDADRSVVSGSATKERSYSEYWTLLRGFGAKGTAHTQPECPRCGAPFQPSMVVACTACGAKVNSGEFDWVLARIEQDEAYEG